MMRATLCAFFPNAHTTQTCARRARFGLLPNSARCVVYCQSIKSQLCAMCPVVLSSSHSKCVVYVFVRLFLSVCVYGFAHGRPHSDRAACTAGAASFGGCPKRGLCPPHKLDRKSSKVHRLNGHTETNKEMYTLLWVHER